MWMRVRKQQQEAGEACQSLARKHERNKGVELLTLVGAGTVSTVGRDRGVAERDEGPGVVLSALI